MEERNGLQESPCLGEMMFSKCSERSSCPHSPGHCRAQNLPWELRKTQCCVQAAGTKQDPAESRCLCLLSPRKGSSQHKGEGEAVSELGSSLNSWTGECGHQEKCKTNLVCELRSVWRAGHHPRAARQQESSSKATSTNSWLTSKSSWSGSLQPRAGIKLRATIFKVSYTWWAAQLPKKPSGRCF